MKTPDMNLLLKRIIPSSLWCAFLFYGTGLLCAQSYSTQFWTEQDGLAQNFVNVVFQDKEGGVSAVVGFYAMLKMRLWRFLSFRNQHSSVGEARADEAPPPHSST